MKRTVIAVCVMLLGCITINAQECRIETIKEYMGVNTRMQAMVSQMKPSLEGFNELFYGHVDELTLNRLTNKYLREQYIDDVAAILQDNFEGVVTESQLKEVIALMSTPDGKDYTLDMEVWNDSETSLLSEYLQSAAELSQIGIKDDPVEVDDDISPIYVNKFLEYAEASDMKGQTVAIFHGVLDGVELPYVFWDWVDENIVPALLNSAYGTVTIADLDFGIMLYNNQSYQNVNDATVSMLSDVYGLGMEILSKYKAWMSDQGIDDYDYDY